MPSPTPSRSLLRYGVALVALLCGLYFSVAFSDRGWLVPTARSLFATEDVGDGAYDLQGLNILSRALLQVKDNYVEPERINPERMLAHALNAIQEEVPQIVCRFDRPLDETPTSVELQVDNATETFDLSAVGSLWEMRLRLREIFRFVQDNLADEDVDLQLVEYSAINGMLDTLDPHSVLLSPDVFADMQANNRGQFGGLGIVISIRQGQLTIISPIDDTPAQRAGLRSGDRILKIGEESTINMNIEEAVGRLRGDPGTSVDIEVMRDGWTVPHEFTLTREIINIRSVKSQVLGDGIGYVEITNFQANTHDDLLEHLRRLREEMGEIRGLVLDLRDNPGGLLEQAIRVADTFLADGTIVTTVGEGHRLREEKKATEEGTEPLYPIVVLVNPGSASASEIVAGALQNHGRALIVGDRTFGKGSVQVLYEFQDGSALKLTIAQYLTPGDVSIQSVGIIPDIGLQAMTISDTMADLYASERVVREGDLDSHLSSERALELRTPDIIVGYLHEPEPEPDPAAIVPPDEFTIDFDIDFARRLLLASGTTWEAAAMLTTTEAERTVVTAEQNELVTAALAERGIDWSSGASPDVSGLEVNLTSDHAEGHVNAGETIQLTVDVTNRGTTPIHRLRAISRSDYPLFDDLEFIFGLVEPGATRSWTVPVEVPVEEVTRLDRIDLRFRTDETAEDRVEAEEVVVTGAERPHFGFAYEIVDDEAGNGDGLLQLHEGVTFRLRVSNVGEGDSRELLVYLKNEVEAAVLLEHGRETWEEGLAAGSTRTADFSFQVQHVPDSGVIRLEVATFDTVFREFTSEELSIPLEPDGELFVGAPEMVRVDSEGVSVRAAADEESHELAHAARGSVLSALGSLGDWTRVEMDGGFIGWVPSDAVSDTSGGEPLILAPAMSLQPPIVALNRDTLFTDRNSFTLSGVLSDDVLVDDYYIWVSSESEDQSFRRVKVSYNHAAGSTQAFTQEVPLFPGPNRISVVARDNERMQANNVLFVYRRTPGEALTTVDDTPGTVEDTP